MTRPTATLGAGHLALALILGGTAAAAAQQQAVAVTGLPTAQGPIPVMKDSYPLMAAATLQDVVDLPAAGYVEAEFFVGGTANVYDWAEGGAVTVRTTGAPYATRLLVRRPVDPSKFSGTVVVELGNTARRYDWAFTWSLSSGRFLENGDAWVGVTYAPVAIEGLKAFNSTRYAALSLANPTPDEACAGGRGQAAPVRSDSEEGLVWDVLSQVGALLRAGRPGGPLSGFAVERVYLTSHGGEIATYASALHPLARLAGGRPVYDGFVIHRHTNMARIRRCAPAPSPGDPRQMLRGVEVPIIRIVAQTDVLGTYARRRDDGDAPGDRYRLYEVAGAPHADAAFYRHIPSVADQEALGTEPYLAIWPFASACRPEIPLMAFPVMQHVVNAAFANLDRWVRDGVAPPRASRIAVADAGTPKARLVLDEFGNAVGGVRSPYLDVPTATYFASTGGPGLCGNLGHKTAFDWARLEALYGSSRAYAAKVADSVDRLVAERWLTEADGRRIKAAALVPGQ
jgi:hypothetical protein